jgi:hypothetical protein
MMYFLYIIESPEGAYIGVSKNPKARFRAHTTARTLVGAAIRKYKSAVSLRVLAAGSREYIYDLEFAAVKRFLTRFPTGYNIASGGRGGRDQLPIHRQKISEARKGQLLSPEHKIKLSIAARKAERISMLVDRNRRPISEATRARLRQSHLGHRPTLETLAKMSAAHMGHRPYGVRAP